MSFKDNYLELTKNMGGPYSLISKGVKRTIIESIMSGSMPSLANAHTVAKVLGVSLEKLLTGEEPVPEVPDKEKFYEPVPLVAGRISCGHGAQPGDIKDWVWIPKKHLPGGGDNYRYAAIVVKGDSMAPLLADGETVVIDRTDGGLDALKKGSLYAVWKDGHSFVKRLDYDKAADTLYLISENPDHARQHGIEYIKLKKMDNPIMGKVVFSYRGWK